MKTKDLLNIVTLKITRNRTSILFYLIMIICSIFIMTSITLFSNFNTFMINLTTKNIGFRTLDVSATKKLNNQIAEEILSIDHVLDVFSSQYDDVGVTSPSFVTENLSGMLHLTYGSSNFLPNIITGRKIVSNEKNVAICPINFIPDDEASEFANINKNLIINGQDLLNKNFTVEYYSTIVT